MILNEILLFFLLSHRERVIEFKNKNEFETYKNKN